MGFKIGVVGAGQFSKCFIPLLQAHPFVEEVALAEVVTSRREAFVQAFRIARSYASLEELLASDVDAVAIFTQRHLHGPHTLQALRAGKHVYCAVPMAQSLEDIEQITNEVVRTGLIYMTGETSYYYPSTILCRDKFKAGSFGDFVYGEAQYMHDMSHGFYDAFKYSGGDDWKKVAGIPPMYYPTHSVSMLLSVTGAKATKVACLGYVDKHEDGIFRQGANLWDNVFSNQTALVSTSDGGSLRLNEFRRVGWGGPNSVYMSMYGTEGSFEEHAGGAAWTSKTWGDVVDLTGDLSCQDAYVELMDLEQDLHPTLKNDFHSTFAIVHPQHRLPLSFHGLPNGHFGSHQFLVDDFVKALHTDLLPPNHVWNAAKYLAPGLIAHESCLRGGEMLAIPDFGDAPSHWSLLDPDAFRAGD
ncbi:Gfo/Idh/MocA family protein [Paenibacillus whitsoniae]|uniref:Gfo/Idh/MocA family oxidoreductase n=1 Tax=Paenibacillus whitsoniae TaxID=2496558 RepID=A0A3S0I742_9BACL|nr:Gfo/Idh/MocA family oxidoreductase [Paenibacillus whitsoniae]RTE04247.1 Gfo/Idh/MocA family oxidoreductase [Paenibacillus whitsoniae]